MGFFKDTIQGAGAFAAGTVTETGKGVWKGMGWGLKGALVVGALVGGLSAFALPAAAMAVMGGIGAFALTGAITAGALYAGSVGKIPWPVSLAAGAGMGGFAAIKVTGILAASAAMAPVAMAAGALTIGAGVAALTVLPLAKLGAIGFGGFNLLTGGTKNLLQWQKNRGTEIQQELEEEKYNNMQARRDLQMTEEQLKEQVHQPNVSRELSEQAIYEQNARQDEQSWVNATGGKHEQRSIEPQKQGRYGISQYTNREQTEEMAAGAYR